MENEVKNNIVGKPMYKCGICGKVYDNIEDRMNCEKKCIHDLKVKNEKIKQEQKEKERKSMEDSINGLANQYYNMIDKYINIYHTYPNVTINNKNNTINVTHDPVYNSFELPFYNWFNHFTNLM